MIANKLFYFVLESVAKANTVLKFNEGGQHYLLDTIDKFISFSSPQLSSLMTLQKQIFSRLSQSPMFPTPSFLCHNPHKMGIASQIVLPLFMLGH